MKVLFVYRSKSLKMFSIENCFNIIKNDLPQEVKVVDCYVPCKNATFLSLLRNSLYVRKIQKTEKCDIVHITGDVHYANLFLNRNNTLLTIHDLRGIHSYSGIKKFLYKLFWIWLPIWKSKKVISISEFTRREIVSLYPAASKKVFVIPDPVNQRYSYCPKKFNSAEPSILMIGSIYNKNLERAIQALNGIKCKFNIIGRLSNAQLSLLEENKIDYVNEWTLNDDEIVKRYIKSDIVLFPSLYEGFGMIIVEAQTIGRPVVTSNIEPLLSVSGNAACFVNPYDVNSIRKGVLKVVNDSEYRTQLVKDGVINAQRFCSAKIALMYFDLYIQMKENC